MNPAIRNTIKMFTMTALLFLALFSHAQAAIEAGVAAGDDGFMLTYNIPIVGRGEVNLIDPGDNDSIIVRALLVTLAQIDFTLNDISTESNTVSLHLDITSPLVSTPFQMDIPVPFGDYGARIRVLGRVLSDVMDDRTVDAAIVFAAGVTRYDVAVNIDPIVSDRWDGRKTPADNVIEEQIVTTDGTVLADVAIQLDYTSSLITTVNYSITLMPSASEGSEGGGGTPIEGALPLPNGSYHIWFDTDMTFGER